ncbi:hypothetical protein SAMN05421831_102151 [Allopseudospirillum japonicum]|uniref:Uncharacterized protein n=1 Tax=Allopseudospirillum japonicum TaxID=64971 RepID=A0A1H6R1Q3_9GAMM|nr:hypothetical protein [Allopseudospirillum japonicum]SEI46407.1 hypothetical protein SAMN05421831_102151 [Allopseudospirillum japonicum]
MLKIYILMQKLSKESKNFVFSVLYVVPLSSLLVTTANGLHVPGWISGLLISLLAIVSMGFGDFKGPEEEHRQP